jgi:hypothetical protein
MNYRSSHRKEQRDILHESPQSFSPFLAGAFFCPQHIGLTFAIYAIPTRLHARLCENRSWSSSMRRCTCGAEVDVRRTTRRTAEGIEEVVYRVSCPVCGQLGPAISLSGKTEDESIIDAIAAWNEMIDQLRPATC